MGRLIRFIIYFFKVGVILGIFRFSYDKKTKCFVKSRFLEIYSVIVWTLVLFYIPYLFYISDSSFSSFANSDKNGIILFKINFLAVYSTFYLSIFSMFWCLFFGKSNLLELANEGINLYRSVTIFKKYPRPSTDRYFWLLFMRNILVGIPMSFLMTVNVHFTEYWSYKNTFKVLFLLYANVIYTYCLDLKNMVFFVATHLLKLLRLDILTLNRKFQHDSKLRANEIQRITKQFHKILNFLHKVDELLSIYTSAIFLYIFVDVTSLVNMNVLNSLFYWLGYLLEFQFFYVYAALTFARARGLDVIANFELFIFEYLLVFITIYSIRSVKKELSSLIKLIKSEPALRLNSYHLRKEVNCYMTFTTYLM
jgi:hypothetical protein